MTRSKFPQVIIFDLDGTLIDSVPDLQGALNELLAGEGLGYLSQKEVKMMIGDGIPNLVRRGFLAAGVNLANGELDEAILEFSSIYSGRLTKLTTTFPGTEEMLKILKKQGCSLAICTNKPYFAANQVLIKLNLAHFFKILIGGDSLSGVKKPNPLPILEILKGLRCPKQDAIMVGDSKNDIEAAKNAGIKSIAVSFGYSPSPVNELGAGATISDFEELIPSIEKMTKINISQD